MNSNIKWLLQRMKYEIKEAEGSYTAEERIIEKYAKMVEIQAKVYGDVFTIEDFIDDVKRGCIMSYDGCGYYWDGEKETFEVSLDVDVLKEKAKEYKYVIWYNK